ncbi:MAG: hypothetical protein ACREFX_11085, partial [Opitutaceae bacterium]
AGACAPARQDRAVRHSGWSGSWTPFRQHWRGAAGAEAGFRPGWTSIRRGAQSVRFVTTLAEASPHNRAVRLNERMWRLGSVCEIFLKYREDRYVELHVTPENRRLQLDWPLDGLASIRLGGARLEDFMVEDEGWCRTATSVGPRGWRIEVELPFGGPDLRAAVCRYDCSLEGRPLLSSSAPLAEAAFHRWWEWPRVG